MNVDQMYEFWRGLKMIIRFGGQVSADAMHINLGLLGFFMFLVLFRRSGHVAIYAWLMVFACQFANELIDAFFDLQTIGKVKAWNVFRDITLTLLWPSIFTVYLLNKRK